MCISFLSTTAPTAETNEMGPKLLLGREGGREGTSLGTRCRPNCGRKGSREGRRGRQQLCCRRHLTARHNFSTKSLIDAALLEMDDSVV